MKTSWVLAILAAGLIGIASSSAQDTTTEEQSDVAGEQSAPADAQETSEVAADIAVGEAIYARVCRNCHGPTAQGMASFPKLAGQTSDYLVMRLETYRAGERVGPNTPLMAPWARELTDEEIASLALYITTGFE